jgi:hypothetical protein
LCKDKFSFSFFFSDEPVLLKLKGQGAFAIDADIRSLETEDEFSAFFDFAQNIMQTHKDFDLVNGYLGLFIKVS